MRHILTKKVLLIALGVETILLGVAAYELSGRDRFVDALEKAARYYADMMIKHDVELSDYDLIALNAIFEEANIVHVAIGEDDRE